MHMVSFRTLSLQNKIWSISYVRENQIFDEIRYNVHVQHDIEIRN